MCVRLIQKVHKSKILLNIFKFSKIERILLLQGIILFDYSTSLPERKTFIKSRLNDSVSISSDYLVSNAIFLRRNLVEATNFSKQANIPLEGDRFVLTGFLTDVEFNHASESLCCSCRDLKGDTQG